MTFIEVLSVELLGTLRAIGSFWSLDRQPAEILHAFGAKGTPTASIGHPEVDYKTFVEGDVVRKEIRHMVYSNAIKEGAVVEKDGWDYIESTIWYPGSPGLPSSFTCVSGGPVWGICCTTTSRCLASARTNWATWCCWT